MRSQVNHAADLGNSYCPISFLCPAIMVLERLLQPELNSIPLSTNHHGFRPNPYTVSTLLPLAHKIAQGFNQPRPLLRTFTMTTDFTKAFDMVNHTKFIHSLTFSSLNNNTE